MANKLMIVMVNTDPRNGAELGAPFFQATVAAAMDYDVEVILTAGSGELAEKRRRRETVRQGRFAQERLRFHEGRTCGRRSFQGLHANP